MAEVTRQANALEQLVAELDSYLPETVRHQNGPGGPTGPGTLKGFHAKIAQVFQLGRQIGYGEAAEEVEEWLQ